MCYRQRIRKVQPKRKLRERLKGESDKTKYWTQMYHKALQVNVASGYQEMN